jgi:hypothetical protein
MDIKRHLFAVGAPVLVTEAVKISAVVSRGEGVVAVGDFLLEGLVLALWIRNLGARPIKSVLDLGSVSMST